MPSQRPGAVRARRYREKKKSREIAARRCELVLPDDYLAQVRATLFDIVTGEDLREDDAIRVRAARALLYEAASGDTPESGDDAAAKMDKLLEQIKVEQRKGETDGS